MRRLFLIALMLTILVPLLAVMLVFLAAAGESAAQCGADVPAGTTGPVGGVPAADIPIFQGAAAQFGLGARGPSILAAIDYVESTFGQSNDAGVHSGANYAGTMGPMQFLQSTWDQYKVQAPGGAVPPNVYDAADAVYSAANYLKASGAPGDWQGAIFAYNHSSVYVQQVLSQAQGYYTQGLTAQGSGSPTTTSGSGSGSATAGSPFAVPPASGDRAAPITLASGQPTIVAATYFTDAIGAWGDNLLVNHDSYKDFSLCATWTIRVSRRELGDQQQSEHGDVPARGDAGAGGLGGRLPSRWWRVDALSGGWCGAAESTSAGRSLDGRGARVEVVWRRLEPGVAEPLALWPAA